MEAVQAFYDAAIAAGAEDDGAPGLRPEYADVYYATFVRDPDGNRIEVVTFCGRGRRMTSGAHRALVAGGTGVVGGEVLKLLAEAPRYQGVTALVRRETDLPEGVSGERIDFEALCDGGALPGRRSRFIFALVRR